MFSLIMFAIIGAYFLLVWFAAWLFRKIALSIKKDKVVGCWGAWIGALAVLLPVFWDVPPTLIAHRYYCATDAGVRVYKTPLQWHAEKAGRVTPVPPKVVEFDEELRRSVIWTSAQALQRQGIILESRDMNLFLTVALTRWRLLDQQSMEVLVEKRSYSAFNKSDDPKKLFLAQTRCENAQDKFPNFKDVLEEFEGVAESRGQF